MEVRFFEFPLRALKFFFPEGVEEASDIYHRHEGTSNLGGQHLLEKKTQANKAFQITVSSQVYDKIFWGLFLFR